MTPSLAPPAVGKLVTLIAVAGGEPLVTYGTVLVSKENLVAVAARTTPDELPRFAETPITVLYGEADYSLILRGRVTGVVPPDRLLITTPNPPRIGERREFIRTDLELALRFEEAPEEVTTAEEALDWVAAFSNDPEDYRFQETTVDLSGSGARFTCPAVTTRKEAFCALTLLLPPDKMQPLIHLPARVVRARPARNLDAALEIALTFLPLEEATSDLLNYVVFEARARTLGVAAVHLQDDE